MNSEILKKYNISFLKGIKGNKFPDGKTVLSSYLAIWSNVDDINDFLNDINLCLNNQFNLVEDPDYSDGLFGIYGSLTPTTLILSGKGGTNPVVIPLVDFNQILLSWKEFLTS